MKEISIQDLKARLSAAVAEAEGGSAIVITRHGRPVAKLAPADFARLHVGKQYGRARLRPLLKTATRGRYLEVLDEDRGGSGR